LAVTGFDAKPLAVEFEHLAWRHLGWQACDGISEPLDTVPTIAAFAVTAYSGCLNGARAILWAVKGIDCPATGLALDYQSPAQLYLAQNAVQFISIGKEVCTLT
jgi:hypothetical protein